MSTTIWRSLYQALADTAGISNTVVPPICLKCLIEYEHLAHLITVCQGFVGGRNHSNYIQGDLWKYEIQ